MNAPPSPLPPKRDVCLALLGKAAVFVHLDPRREGVLVPPWFRKQPQLVLQIGYEMAKTIPDLNVSEDSLTCTLSFSNSPFFCCLPWSSVFALVGEDGRGMVWPEDVPSEVAAQVQQRSRSEAGPGTTDEDPARPPEATKAKKSRSKGTKRRPTVVATPTASVTPIKPVREERWGQKVAGDAASGADGHEVPPPPAVPAGKKPKRELPPYLRIIK